MGDLTPDGPRADLTTRFTTALRALLALVVVLTLVSGGGVVAAGDENPGNPGRSCPGENPNVGYERATSNTDAAKHSLKGITRAAHVIGCPSLPE